MDKAPHIEPHQYDPRKTPKLFTELDGVGEDQEGDMLKIIEDLGHKLATG